MSTITFDTQIRPELVTKKDLQIELAPLKADLLVLKWMVGAVLGMVVANFAKQFF